MQQGEHSVKADMDGLKLALWAVGGFFALSLFPVGMAALSGPAAAGASSGFTAPLQDYFHILLFFIIGLVSSWQARVGIFLLPLSFAFMLCIGALTDISMAQLPLARVSLFAFTLFFALAVSAAYTRLFVICASVAAAFAYFLGTRYMQFAPDVASLPFFLAGTVLSAGLIIGCGVSLGIATHGYLARARLLAARVPLIRLFLARQ